MALVRAPHRWITYVSEIPDASTYTWKILNVRTDGIELFDFVAAMMLRGEFWDHEITWSVTGDVTQEAQAAPDPSFNYNHWVLSSGGTTTVQTQSGITTHDVILPLAEPVITEATLIELQSPAGITPDSRRLYTVGDAGYGGAVGYVGESSVSGTWRNDEGTDPHDISFVTHEAYKMVFSFAPPSAIQLYRFTDGNGPNAHAYISGPNISASFHAPTSEGFYPHDLTDNHATGGSMDTYGPTDNFIVAASESDGFNPPQGPPPLPDDHLRLKGHWTIHVPNWIGSGTTSKTFELWGSEDRTDFPNNIPDGFHHGFINCAMDITTTFGESLPYGYDPANPLTRTTMNRAWNLDGTAARTIWPSGGGRSPA